MHDRPSWQRARGVPDTPGRKVPDVAGPADCDSAFLVVYPQRVDDLWEQVTAPSGCGTSAAAPFWAGVAALIRQYVGSRRVDSKIGFIGEYLYEASRRPGELRPFRDVQTGGNLDRDATRGWDYATGLGTPRAWDLAERIAQLATPSD